MEHVLQIGINVDDDAIRKAALDQCSKQIMDDIKRVVTNGDRYARYDSKLLDMVNNHIGDFCEKHREVIIAGAINQLADKLAKTKAVKEHVRGLLISDTNDENA